jgi:hypothetical protein
MVKFGIREYDYGYNNITADIFFAGTLTCGSSGFIYYHKFLFFNFYP